MLNLYAYGMLITFIVSIFAWILLWRCRQAKGGYYVSWERILRDGAIVCSMLSFIWIVAIPVVVITAVAWYLSKIIFKIVRIKK